MADKQSQGLKEIFAQRSPTVSDLAKAAGAGDAAAREAFARFGKYLGIGIANLVDLFNPDLIVLAGPLTEAQAFFMEAVAAEVEKHACAHSNRQIMISRLGDDAMSMGACGAVLQSIFEVEGAGNSALQEAGNS
jgi:predicted NBD/HSP70 family sugar kinase